MSATPRVCKCSPSLSLFSSRLASHASPPYLKGPSNRKAKGEGLSGTSVLRQQRPPIFGKKKISHTERAEDNSTAKASQPGLPRLLLTFQSSSLCDCRSRPRKEVEKTNLQLANTTEGEIPTSLVATLAAAFICQETDVWLNVEPQDSLPCPARVATRNGGVEGNL